MMNDGNNKIDVKSNIKAECTWGDGPDVILGLSGSKMILLEAPTVKDGGFIHGTICEGNLDLTVEEALTLANELISAAYQANELEQTCKDHDEEMDKYDNK